MKSSTPRVECCNATKYLVNVNTLVLSTHSFNTFTHNGLISWLNSVERTKYLCIKRVVNEMLVKMLALLSTFNLP